MKYNNRLNYRDRRRLLFRLRIIFFLVALALIGIVIYFYVDFIKDKTLNEGQEAVSEKTTSVIAPSVNIFKTAFYQFQASDSWVEVPNESNSSKFVYRSLRTNLIEHELVIYVNQVPVNLEANRVMPVDFAENKQRLIPSPVSEHCVKALGGRSTVSKTEVTFEKVRFNCDSDSTNYTVIVGELNGDSVVNMIRPSGESVAYTIYYSNLKAINDAIELTDIMKSFQTR